MEQNDFEKALEQEIYGLRMLVLLECSRDCEKDIHFHQISVDSEQFKKISDIVFKPTSPPDEDGYEEGAIVLSEQTLPVELFEGLTDIDL